MSTSGSTSFNSTRDEIVWRALRLVGAYASTDVPRPEQVNDAVIALNMMLKSWQTEGFLWLKEYFQIPLVAGQYYYSLGPAGTAQYWPMLTTTIDRPTRVWNLKRKDSQGQEIPLNAISRQEYTDLPRKTTEGVPNQYYYDPQLVNGTLFVWPAPQTGTTDVIWGTCDRPIQDMLSDENTYDVPQEWLRVITYGLAREIAAEYGLSLGERQLLDSEYSSIKQAIDSYDRENASSLIQREYI